MVTHEIIKLLTQHFGLALIHRVAAGLQSSDDATQLHLFVASCSALLLNHVASQVISLGSLVCRKIM